MTNTATKITYSTSASSESRLFVLFFVLLRPEAVERTVAFVSPEVHTLGGVVVQGVGEADEIPSGIGRLVVVRDGLDPLLDLSDVAPRVRGVMTLRLDFVEPLFQRMDEGGDEVLRPERSLAHNQGFVAHGFPLYLVETIQRDSGGGVTGRVGYLPAT